MESSLLAFLISCGLAGYSYLASKKVRPGALRAILLLPVSAVFFLLPVLLVDGRENPFLAQSLCCILAMSAFKIIALCGGRGCLSSQHLDAWTFFGICLLPIIPTSTAAFQEPNKRAAAVLRWVRSGVAQLACSVLLAAVGLVLLKVSNDQQQRVATTSIPIASTAIPNSSVTIVNVSIPDGTTAAAGGDDAHVMITPGVATYDTPPRHAALGALLTWVHPIAYFLAGVALMTEVSGMGDLVDAISLQLFALVPEPHFNRPWSATSFSDFWARRWNLTVSSVLRAAIYEPIVEGRWVTVGDGPAVSYSSPPTSPGCVSVASHGTQGRTETGSNSALSSSPVATCAVGLRRRHVTSDVQPAATVTSPAASTSAATTTSATSAATAAMDITPMPYNPPTESAECTSTAAATAPAATAPAYHASADDDKICAEKISAIDIDVVDGKTVPVITDREPERQPITSESPAGGGGGATAGRGPVARRGVSRSRRLVASLASFIVSGLWHELLFYTLVRRSSGGNWLLLFMLQPFVLFIELHLKRAAAVIGFLPTPLLAKLGTHGLLLVQLALLWYPPMISSGMVDNWEQQGFRAATAVTAAARMALGSVRTLLLLVHM